MRRLNVFVDQQLVGQLQEGAGLWTFAYEEAWSRAAHSFDISPALPRSQAVHTDGGTMRPVQWFFDNLLPEEDLRKAIAREAEIRDSQDAFAMLEYLGAESAGSLTLLPPDAQLPRTVEVRELSDAELSARIANLPRSTLAREAPKRMSVAGAQHKLLVVLRQDRLFEPVGATPSTHILKPDHPKAETYPVSAFNEFLTMRLAAAAKLTVPAVYLRYVPQPVYIIERFDRMVPRRQVGDAPPAVRRLHVLDACQLLNRDRLYKHTGATLQALKDIIDACNNKAATRQALFRWLVFNVVVGNDDSHLKNLSFHSDAEGVRLAPHYDLLCTGAYHTKAIADAAGYWPDVPMTFRLPGARTFAQVTRESLIEAAQELKLPAKVAERILDDVAARVDREFALIAAEHERLVAQASPEQVLDLQMQSRLLRIIGHIVLEEMLRKVRAG